MKIEFDRFCIFWRWFTLFAFAFLIWNLVSITREVFYRVTFPTDFQRAEFEIDLCYKTNIENDKCYKIGDDHLANPPEHEKLDFTCDFEEQIGCYTKNFKELNANDIIEKFRNCDLSSLATVEPSGEFAKESIVVENGIQYELYNGHICLKHKFFISNDSDFDITGFEIKANENAQMFTSFLTVSATYSDGIYKTKKTEFFERKCWMNEDEDQIECTANDRKFYFEFALGYLKNLEFPFDSNCVFRTSKNESLVQNDCYEECVKKHSKNYLLTYSEKDNFRLDYDLNDKTFTKARDVCARKCYQVDCTIADAFFRNIWYEIEESQPKDQMKSGSIALKINFDNWKYEAVGLYSKPTRIYLFVLVVFMFFRLSFYNRVLKGTIYKIKTQAKEIKNRDKIKFILMMLGFIFGLIVCLLIEKFIFDFGKENDEVYLIRDSIEERNASVSFCFDFCKIIKPEYEDEYKDCLNQTLIEKTIGELDDFTWNVTGFKKHASMRNTVKVYPIRHDEFEIDYFFRGFKKCFRLFYNSSNYWPHLAMQKASKIHMNITKIKGYEVFIEDGYSFPKLNSTNTTYAVLHTLHSSKTKYACKNYDNGVLKNKDAFIQDCMIQKALKEEKIPVDVNLIANKNNFSEYSSLKFTTDKEFHSKILKECENEFYEDECIYFDSLLTRKNITRKTDDFSVNLAPNIFELVSLENEAFMIILNRICSILMLITGLSARELISVVVSAYFIDFLKRFNYQLARRLVFLGIFAAYFIHLLLLILQIMYYPLMETAHFHYIQELEFPKVRFCYELKEDLSSNKITVENLEGTSLNLSDVLERILIFDENGKVAERISPIDCNHTDQFRNLYCYKDKKIISSIDMFYLHDLKCFNFVFFADEKVSKDIGVHYKRLNRLAEISFKRLDRTTFLFINRENLLDFSWDKAFYPVDYVLFYTLFENDYSDDYWIFKNFFFHFKNVVGFTTALNEMSAYLNNLARSFSEEQYSKTSMIPLKLWDTERKTVKNRQFNSFIQFRAIATKYKNEYDFTKNLKKSGILNTYYVEKTDNKSKNMKILLKSNLVKYEFTSRNRYRFTEVFIYFFALTSFWFKIDFFSLPEYMKQSYPYFKFFTIYFLYYVVCFIVILFELWFSFIKFLRFRDD